MVGKSGYGSISQENAGSADPINTLLLLLPSIIPILGAVGILVIRAVKPGFGLAWFSAFLVSLFNWGLLIFYRFQPPSVVIIPEWIPLSGVSGSVVLQMDQVAWAYAFSLTSLLMMVIMTAPVRLQHQSNPGSWAACLAVAGVGNLAMISATPIAIILAWTILDVFELIVILVGVPQQEIKTQSVIAFATRFLGTLMLIFAMILSRGEGKILILVDPSEQVGLFILIAAGLRLGVLPLHLPYTREIPMRRGLGTMLRLTSPLASLLILARLPVTVVPQAASPYLLGITAVVALYGAAKWVSAKEEISGRPFWLISIAGMALACSIRGYPIAGAAWGVSLALAGGMVFLHSIDGKGFKLIPLAGALLFSGLPFTLTASGWDGLVVLPLNLPDFLFWVTHALLLLGFVRHAVHPREPAQHLDRWMRTIYVGAFGLLMGSAGLMIGWGWGGSFFASHWWSGVISAVLAGGLLILLWRVQVLIKPGGQTQWLSLTGRRVGKFLSDFFSLGWLYTIHLKVLAMIQRGVLTVTSILESEGGLLWVFVLLSLILSVSLMGGGQ